jgi:hypothetical protein
VRRVPAEARDLRARRVRGREGERVADVELSQGSRLSALSLAGHTPTRRVEGGRTVVPIAPESQIRMPLSPPATDELASLRPSRLQSRQLTASR